MGLHSYMVPTGFAVSNGYNMGLNNNLDFFSGIGPDYNTVPHHFYSHLHAR